MKQYLNVALLSLIILSVKAQTTTIIVLRHAEKDTTVESVMMKADPPLTKAGEVRAIQLLKVLKAYQPDVIYSTNYSSTTATVAPLAQKFAKEIVIYDPTDLPKFAEELRLQKGKTIVVAGHSNAAPALVNALLKQSKYKALSDQVYNKLWVVTITDTIIADSIVEY